MTTNDGWAKASLRLVGSGLSPSLLDPALAVTAVPGPRGDVIVFPVADDAESDLQQLLTDVEQFAHEHRDGLSNFRRRTGADLQVFLGWSPCAPQESLSFSASLLALLADLGAGIVIDTYSE